MAVLEVNVAIGQTYVIGGAVVRFKESTSKKTKLALAIPAGGQVEFREANAEEKALTYGGASG